jgi:hypothetical protein
VKPFLGFRLGFFSVYIPVSFTLLLIGAAIVVGLFLALMGHEALYEQAHPTHYHSMLGTP